MRATRDALPHVPANLHGGPEQGAPLPSAQLPGRYPSATPVSAAPLSSTAARGLVPVAQHGGPPPGAVVARPVAVPAAPPAESARPSIDIDALVDKVQRKLMRNLAAERERKGGLR